MNNTERVIAYLAADTWKRLDQRRVEIERKTGVKPSVSAMINGVLSRALSEPRQSA